MNIEKSHRGIRVVENKSTVISFTVVYNIEVGTINDGIYLDKMHHFYKNIESSDEYLTEVIDKIKILLDDFLDTMGLKNDAIIFHHDIDRPSEWTDVSIHTKLEIPTTGAINFLKIKDPETYYTLIKNKVLMLKVDLDDIQ